MAAVRKNRLKRGAGRLRLLAILAFCLPVYSVASAQPTSNEDLREQIELQKKEIETLSKKVDALENREDSSSSSQFEHLLSDRLIISGRGALAYFDQGEDGAFPNNEFRVDEARLRLDVKLTDDAYVFTEINYTEREDNRRELWLGELYLDLENITSGQDNENLLNLRLGRFNIPFGEEYQYRDAIDDPLISHSLADFWGVDEGLAVFGRASKWDYILAVQNGGTPSLHDYNSDKSVVLRVGFEPTKAWRLSASVMRTGDLDAEGDETSELWFGNGVFRPINLNGTNITFHAEIAQLDARYRWDGGHFIVSGGALQYDDDDPSADQKRDAYFYSVESDQNLTKKFYVAGRFSQIKADDGFPILGQGTYGAFLGDNLVTDIWRLSLGVGYRYSNNLVFKGEYSFERGERQDGEKLDNQDMVSAQAAFSF